MGGIKDSGVAVLEGSDAARIEERLKDIAHNPLPIQIHNLHLKRFYEGLQCIAVSVGPATWRCARVATRDTICDA